MDDPINEKRTRMAMAIIPELTLYNRFTQSPDGSVVLLFKIRAEKYVFVPLRHL